MIITVTRKNIKALSDAIKVAGVSVKQECRKKVTVKLVLCLMKPQDTKTYERVQL
jgi:hypothetical protein